MPKSNFQVAIMHGHSFDYKKIKKLVKSCGFTPRVLIEEYSANTIFNNFRNLIWDEIHCVIVILTKDDEMKNGTMRARQNVVYELGYCFGAFDSLRKGKSYQPENAIIVVSEKDVEIFADIQGLTRIEYEENKIAEKLDFIKKCLLKSYSIAKKFYWDDDL